MYFYYKKIRTQVIVLLVTAIFSTLSLYSQTSAMNDAITSQSYLNWENNTFISSIELDTDAANIQLPSGRNIATSRIEQNLPLLVKSPLLSITVNSSTQLAEAVLWDLVSIEDVSDIVEEGTTTPAIFSRTGNSLSTRHTISLQQISQALIQHQSPYQPSIPIKTVSSRAYTGIIIDARGQLPVQGEFTSESVQPALFPRIWDDNMSLLYELNMAEPEIVKESGLVRYATNTFQTDYQDRVGSDPLRITARGVFGIHRTDPIISENDALKILSVQENIDLLTQGKVIILVDEEKLAHSVKAPVKDEAYFYMVQEVNDFVFENIAQDLEVIDTDRGMLIPLRDLKFIPDSADLLPAENSRLDILAQSLLIATQNGESTILVEGHTANVGRPEGELQLSNARALTIIDEMVERGVDETLFTYRGYGGEFPIGDNNTEEGRALNRRVEITVIPKTTYIQRIY